MIERAKVIASYVGAVLILITIELPEYAWTRIASYVRRLRRT